MPGFPTQPMPLGQLKPGASYATVVVQVISNLKAAGYLTSDYNVRELVIQAAPANSGNITITNSNAVPAADYSNVLRILLPGEYYAIGSYFAANSVDPRNYYVSAANATDFALGEAREG